MKKSTLTLALAFAGLFVTSASAQLFVGSDDFSSGAAKWSYSFRIAGSGTSNGALTFSGTQLDYSKGAGAGSFYRGWDGDGAGTASRTSDSLTTSWVADLTVTNTAAGLAGGEYASLGLEVAGSGGQYSAIMLGASSGGSFLRAEGIGFSAVEVGTGDATDVNLRLAWDAGTQVLSSYYSFDGTNYTALATFNPVSQWTGGSAAGGYFFEVFGNSNAAAAISAGSVYADNFAVSAIPEPSTYAAFAGLGALGLAVWRRRQARAAAKA
jgi:hypothetical protein